MRRLPLILLIMVLAACERPKAPARPPTADELGAELATYAQVLVPLAPETVENVRRAAAFKGTESVRPGDFQPVDEHVTADIAGSSVTVLMAYSGAWLLPRDQTSQPMTSIQFLHALGEDQAARFAVLITPKGNLFVGKEQLLDVMIAARKAGAATEDIPFTIIRGAAPERR